jgi:hypothetical protein
MRVVGAAYELSTINVWLSKMWYCMLYKAYEHYERGGTKSSLTNGSSGVVTLAVGHGQLGIP